MRPVSILALVVLAVAALWPLSCGSAQQLDPRALEVYAKAVRAAKDLKQLEYSASVTERNAERAESGRPAAKDSTGDKAAYLVRIDFGGASKAMPMAARMRVERRAPGPVEALVVGESDAVFIPESGARTRSTEWAQVGKPFFGALPDWVFFVRLHADPLATEWGGATRIVVARFFGVQRFDGVDCEVIGIEREQDIGSRRPLVDGRQSPVETPTQVSRVRELLAIGQADHLPRSIAVMDLGASNTLPERVRVLELTGVRIDGAVAPDSYSTADREPAP